MKIIAAIQDLAAAARDLAAALNANTDVAQTIVDHNVQSLALRETELAFAEQRYERDSALAQEANRIAEFQLEVLRGGAS